jgi:hypothetical protein
MSCVIVILKMVLLLNLLGINSHPLVNLVNFQIIIQDVKILLSGYTLVKEIETVRKQIHNNSRRVYLTITNDDNV